MQKVHPCPLRSTQLLAALPNVLVIFFWHRSERQLVNAIQFNIQILESPALTGHLCDVRGIAIRILTVRANTSA